MIFRYFRDRELRRRLRGQRLPDDKKLGRALEVVAARLAYHAPMSGAGMFNRLLQLLAADFAAIREAQALGIDPDDPRCFYWWHKPGNYGTPRFLEAIENEVEEILNGRRSDGR